ncbi:MAG: DUF4231 domain-containing protein [Propionibacteriaceae bacterium]|jgi:hypothetical protein|nr:DUF4231 domain-containing protein [Propionibacteriaceae bacterium]
MTEFASSGPLQYPALFESAESESAESQKLFFTVRAAELASLTAAAALALVPIDWAGRAGPILTVLMFVVALGVQVSRVGSRAERRWYDARAAAESIKSASWQYAVGGEAFRISDTQADVVFVERLRDALRGLKHLNFGAARADCAAVTESMRRVRQSSQAERFRVYREHRVSEQVEWYKSKADWNRQRSRVFAGMTIGVEFLALVLGLLRVTGRVDVDLLGVATTAAAGLVAWSQAKNYSLLAESYAVTSHEILLVSDSMKADVTEAAWAQSVHDAEAAFSREHTLWSARRQGQQA